MSINELHDRNAFNLLFADIVERLLANADNPGRASEFIAEELRSLIGAKTVLVFECATLCPTHVHRLLSVFPERRRSYAELPGVEAFLESTHRSSSVSVLESIPSLGAGLSVVLPLVYGSQRVGAVLLLDLLERLTVDKALHTLERLSGILALVIRNAAFYTSMEDEIARRTNALERSLAEKEVLLREVHHRVLNNLQIVLSFLNLKASGPVGEETRSILQDCQSRVYAMALVHEEIFQTGNFALVDATEYAQRIVDAVMDASCPSVRRVFHWGRPLRLPLASAIPCGLIVAELAMNSAKHAYIGREGGVLKVSSGQRGGRGYIEIVDDGPGFPKGSPGNRGGIGFGIVESLLGQLKATLELSDQGTPGARAVLRFPIPRRG